MVLAILGLALGVLTTHWCHAHCTVCLLTSFFGGIAATTTGSLLAVTKTLTVCAVCTALMALLTALLILLITYFYGRRSKPIDQKQTTG